MDEMTTWIGTGIGSLGGVAALKVAAGRTLDYLRERYRVVSAEEWEARNERMDSLARQLGDAVDALRDAEDRYAALRMRAAELSVRYRALAGTLDDEYNPDIAED